jgi:hypothetical protein
VRSGIAKRAAESGGICLRNDGRVLADPRRPDEGKGQLSQPDDFAQIAREFELPPHDDKHASALKAAELRVQEDCKRAPHRTAWS